MTRVWAMVRLPSALKLVSLTPDISPYSQAAWTAEAYQAPLPTSENCPGV